MAKIIETKKATTEEEITAVKEADTFAKDLGYLCITNVMSILCGMSASAGTQMIVDTTNTHNPDIGMAAVVGGALMLVATMTSNKKLGNSLSSLAQKKILRVESDEKNPDKKKKAAEASKFAKALDSFLLQNIASFAGTFLTTFNFHQATLSGDPTACILTGVGILTNFIAFKSMVDSGKSLNNIYQNIGNEKKAK